MKSKKKDEKDKDLDKAKMALYIIKGANESGYEYKKEMIEHLQTIANNIYEDITKER